MKVNWDAACNIKEGRYGFGSIIRDYRGLVIGTMRAVRTFHVSPLIAEAYGLLLTALFCKNAGLNNLILEGDSLQVVKLIQSRETHWSRAGLFIQDVIHLLDSFSSWSVKHIRTELHIAWLEFPYIYLKTC